MSDSEATPKNEMAAPSPSKKSRCVEPETLPVDPVEVSPVRSPVEKVEGKIWGKKDIVDTALGG